MNKPRIERLSDILTAIALCDDAELRMGKIERVRELMRDYDMLDVAMPKIKSKPVTGESISLCNCKLCISKREYMARKEVSI